MKFIIKQVKPIWKQQQKHKRNLELKFYQYGLKWEREKLYSNIEDRVDKMIANGLVEEVKNILDMGFNKKLNSLNTVGYKEIFHISMEKLNLKEQLN